VLALVRDVLGQFGQRVEGVEDLKIPWHATKQIATGWLGKGTAPRFFGAVDHLATGGDLDHAGQAERAAGRGLVMRFLQGAAPS